MRTRSDGQGERPLGIDGGSDGGGGIGEHRAHPVAGVLEDEPAVALDRRPQQAVVAPQRIRHAVCVRLPRTRGALDVGEKERPDLGGRPVTVVGRR